MMVDPWIHVTADPVHADVGDYNGPLSAVFAGGERSAAESVVSVSEIGTKAKNSAGKPVALVLHSEMLGGPAGSPVLGTAQDRNDLAEKALILTERSNSGYVRLY